MRQEQNNERRSRLLVLDDSQRNEGEMVTLSHPIKELCSVADAFIYVVNSASKARGEIFSCKLISSCYSRQFEVGFL